MCVVREKYGAQMKACWRYQQKSCFFVNYKFIVWAQGCAPN